MADINSGLKAFNAVEANINRAEELWTKAKALIPEGLVIVQSGDADAIEYRGIAEDIETIVAELPSIDGYTPVCSLIPLEDIFSTRFDFAELGEPLAEITYDNELYKPGEVLTIYKKKYVRKRREFVRKYLQDELNNIDELIQKLRGYDLSDPQRVIEGEHWDALKAAYRTIGVLLGSVFSSPSRWGDMARHLHFGLACDLGDIIELDWPEVKKSIIQQLIDLEVVIPVGVKELSDLSDGQEKGTLTSSFNWGSISSEQLELLIYKIFDEDKGYKNVELLMHHNAPDHGRDVSAYRLSSDGLVDHKEQRVIVQCRHWQTKSINIGEIDILLKKMKIWDKPRVNELIIVTTGWFTTEAVQYVENRNEEGEIPTVVLWNKPKLESLISSRPHHIAQFGLD